LEDTALAISKGAALVANGIIEIIPTCKISVGLVCKQVHHKELQTIELPLLQKGEKIDENQAQSMPVQLNSTSVTMTALFKYSLEMILIDII